MNSKEANKKICDYCGRKYVKKSNNQRYCGNDCNQKSFFKRHPNKSKEYKHKFYLEHRDEILKKQLNSDDKKKYQKKWYQNNKEKIHKIKQQEGYKEKHRIRALTCRKFKDELLKDAKCRICDIQHNLEIHHKYYTGEKKDCEVLCKVCHDKIHRICGGEENVKII